MMESLLPYNLEFHHIAGEENNVADFGSRYPRAEISSEEFQIYQPGILHQSRRMMELLFDAKDPEAI